MALNWNAVLSNTKNLNDVLAILRKILALMDSKTDSDVIDRALRDIDELKEEVARLSNLVEHCNCSTEPEPENPGGEDRFIISCMPPEGQQQIILNKVRNTLPFLTFRNITFDIYISGTLAASDVLMLDVDAMDSVGLQVEDLTGNGREISIKNKTDERRAFELSPIEEPNFARDTDIELGHVVVEKYSFHFCLAPVSVEPENPDGGDRFIISCTPPEVQQRIVLNKVRNTLPFLTFNNVVFDIYTNGIPAASGVSLLDAAVMDLHGLKVEDLTGNGRKISITPTSGKHKAFELMPTMGSFADDTDIEEGHVVVEKGSFHFCLAAAANDLPVTLEWKIEGDGTLYSDRVENVTESSKRNLNITELRTYNGLEIISAQAFLQNKITSLTIADTVWLIGQNSFAENQITELVLGSGLKMLGNYAFKDNAISAVTVHAVIPPEVESDSWPPFDGNLIASIRVPAESVNAYKAAEYWSSFSPIITAI